MKIVTVIGTRPNFIKAAPLSREAASRPGVSEVIVHTGQHYDANMSAAFFSELSIPKPDYHFDVSNLPTSAMVPRMMEQVGSVLDRERPDWVLVYGDTNSTLAGALAAKTLGCKLAHVEAGLRSHDQRMQEEHNRVLTDRISDLLCCPTKEAENNLLKEGFASPDAILQCGDVMFDAALLFKDKARRPESLPGVTGPFIAATVHRAENTDDPAVLAAIFSGLERVARTTPVVLPLHPRTRNKLADMGYDFAASPLTLVEPVGYLEMLWLLDNCTMLLTDGGGLQKEAFFFAKPCVTLRGVTEWKELVGLGANILVGHDPDALVRACEHFSGASIDFSARPYGHGAACATIIDRLLARA